MGIYKYILEDCILRMRDLVRGRHYVEDRRFLEKSQWWSRDKLQAFQWREARALLTHAFMSVPHYQEKYRKAGIRLEDIRSLEDWRLLPVLTRQEINQNRKELCAVNFPEKLSVHATGGSSGVPTRFFITDKSYDWRTAATQRVYSWTGCNLGERSAYLWGAPVGKVPLWKSLKMKTHESIQRQLILNTFAQDNDSWIRIYERLRSYQPRLLVGYVSSLHEFSRFLRRTGRELRGVTAVIAAAEPLFGTVRDDIEQAVKAPVFNTYGSREFMSIGGECEQHDGLHINSENLFVETSDPHSDQPSEILVTDLHNLGMPFIRYAIGDLGTMDTSPCVCGRQLPRLKAIEGRVLDVLRRRDGRIIPGEFFPHVLKDIPEIAEYQVRQVSIERVVISAVLEQALSAKSKALLDREVEKVCGAGLQVELDSVSEIPRLQSGKRRVTVGLS